MFQTIKPRIQELTISVVVSLFCLLSIACKIEVVSFPSSIEVGKDVEFVIQVENNDLESHVQYLTARIPEGWDLTSAIFENSTATPESGLLELSDLGPFCLSSEGGPDYQTIVLETNPPVTAEPGDSAILRLRFHINSIPNGPFRTWFNVVEPQAGATCEFLVTTWRQNQLPSYAVGSDIPIDHNYYRTSPSAFGPFVYFANGDILKVFRQSVNGNLSHAADFDNENHPTWGLDNCDVVNGRTREDRSSVYIGCEESTLVLNHETPNSSELSFQQRILVDQSAFYDLEFERSSPSGNLFSRRLGSASTLYSTSELGFITHPIRTIPGDTVALTADESYAYTIDSYEIKAYNLATESPSLIQVVDPESLPTDLSYPSDLVVRPDGEYLYVSSRPARNITVFSRDSQSGLLAYQSTISNVDHPQTLGLFGPLFLSMSHDGLTLVAISRNASAVSFFDVSPQSGNLQFRDVIFHGDPYASQLLEVNAGTFSPDDRFFYLSTRRGLVMIRTIAGIFSDGFESGGTSEWSNTTP